jgi:hypothetical protein
MSRLRAPTPTNESFICVRCGTTVTPPETGTEQRNHCPHCLWSLHVDLRIGDRRSGCRGAMEPVGVWTKENGEWALIHRCVKCGFLRANRISGDDDELRLFALAAKPLTRLPFPYGLIDAYEVTRKK